MTLKINQLMFATLLSSFCSIGVTSALAADETSATPEISCPKTVNGYVAGEADVGLVQRCMGNPAHEDHNPDGRYVYLYNIDSATTITFLFASSGKLIRTRGYKQN